MASSGPIGFAGLRLRRSDVSEDLAALAQLPAESSTARTTPDTSAAPPQSDGSWKRVGWIGGAIAVIGLLVWLANSGSTSSSSVPAVDTAPVAPKSASGALPSADAGASLTSITETAPLPAQAQQLNVDEIAYCLAEEVRLGAAQTRVDTTAHSQVAAFNTAVDDYNSRCSNYRYLPSDKDRAQAYVDARRELLTAAGAARVGAARDEPPEAPPADSTPVDAPAEEPQP